MDSDENQVVTKFLEEVCSKYNCGSQRCDGSPEWVEGCKLYQDYKKRQIPQE